jgi:hypothetical protein
VKSLELAALLDGAAEAKLRGTDLAVAFDALRYHDRLIEALRPFAEMKLHSAVPDSWAASRVSGITAGQIRAARELLAEIEGAGS